MSSTWSAMPRPSCSRRSRCSIARRIDLAREGRAGMSTSGGRPFERRAMTDADPINPMRIFPSCRNGSRRMRSSPLTPVPGELVRPAPAVHRRRPRVSVWNAGDHGARCSLRDGAKWAHPGRPSIALVGDGAMQMNRMAELITVAQLLAAVDRSPTGRRGAAQQRPQPGDVGDEGDGELTEVRGLPVAARRRLRRLCSRPRPGRGESRRSRRARGGLGAGADGGPADSAGHPMRPRRATDTAPLDLRTGQVGGQGRVGGRRGSTGFIKQGIKQKVQEYLPGQKED